MVINLKDAGELMKKGMYGGRLEIKEGGKGSYERSARLKNKRGTEVLMTARNSSRKVTSALWPSSYLRAAVDCQGR